MHGTRGPQYCEATIVWGGPTTAPHVFRGLGIPAAQQLSNSPRGPGPRGDRRPLGAGLQQACSSDGEVGQDPVRTGTFEP